MGCTKLTYNSETSPLKVVHSILNADEKSGAGEYRYGFNGKEKDDEAHVGIYDYGFRIYDCRIAKFLSVDPLSRDYPYYTPYQFAGNSPIRNLDLDGLEDQNYLWNIARQGTTYLVNKTAKFVTEKTEQVATNTYDAAKKYVVTKKQEAQKATSAFMKQARPHINYVSDVADKTGDGMLVVGGAAAAIGVVAPPVEAFAIPCVQIGAYLKTGSDVLNNLANVVESLAEEDGNKTAQAVANTVVNIGLNKVPFAKNAWGIGFTEVVSDHTEKEAAKFVDTKIPAPAPVEEPIQDSPKK